MNLNNDNNLYTHNSNPLNPGNFKTVKLIPDGYHSIQTKLNHLFLMTFKILK